MKKIILILFLLESVSLVGCQHKQPPRTKEYLEWTVEMTKEKLDSACCAGLDSCTKEGFFQWEICDSLAGDTLIIDHIRYIFVTEAEYEKMSDSERRRCFIN